MKHVNLFFIIFLTAMTTSSRNFAAERYPDPVGSFFSALYEDFQGCLGECTPSPQRSTIPDSPKSPKDRFFASDLEKSSLPKLKTFLSEDDRYHFINYLNHRDWRFVARDAGITEGYLRVESNPITIQTKIVAALKKWEESPAHLHKKEYQEMLSSPRSVAIEKIDPTWKELTKEQRLQMRDRFLEKKPKRN